MTIYELRDKVFGSLAWEPVAESAVCDKWRNHCCEHFMKALEALKQADHLGSLIANPADIKLAQPIRVALRDAIREMEEVET